MDQKDHRKLSVLIQLFQVESLGSMCGDNSVLLLKTYKALRKQYAYSSFVILCMILNGMNLGVKLIEFYLKRLGGMGFGDN